MTVILESLDDFNLETLKRVAWDREPVAFGAQALARMRTARQQFLDLIEREPDLHVYGVTTGYDEAAGTIVGPGGAHKTGNQAARPARRRRRRAAAGKGRAGDDLHAPDQLRVRLHRSQPRDGATGGRHARRSAAPGRSSPAGLAGRAPPAHQPLRRAGPRTLPGTRRERDRERRRLHARPDRRRRAAGTPPDPARHAGIRALDRCRLDGTGPVRPLAQRDDGRRARGGGDRRLERDARGRADERPAYVPEPDLVANRRPHARPHVPDGRRGRRDRPQPRSAGSTTIRSSSARRRRRPTGGSSRPAASTTRPPTTR